MLRVISNSEGATLSVGIDMASRNQVVWAQSAPVANGERFMLDGITNRTPDVDNSNAAFQETFRFGSQVMVNTVHAGLVSLVDMNALLRGMDSSARFSVS